MQNQNTPWQMYMWLTPVILLILVGILKGLSAWLYFSFKGRNLKNRCVLSFEDGCCCFCFLSEQEEFYKYTRSKLHWQADFKGYLKLDWNTTYSEG